MAVQTAAPAASPLAFITGSQGGNLTLSPEALSRRQALAAALIKEGGNYSPIQSPWQGVARVADAISGSVQQHWADQDYANSLKAGAAQWADALGSASGYGAGGATGTGQAASAGAGSGGGAPAATADVTQYQPMIDQAQQKYGLPDGYLTQLITVESGGRNDAVSPTGAKGLTQFTSGTAKAYGLTNPFDPAANIDAAGRLAADNAKYLTAALGRPPTAGELYLAHQQGAQSAAQLLAHPNDPATQWAPQGNLAVNGYKPGMTAGQFASQWTNRFGNPQVAQAASPQQASAGQPVVTVDPLPPGSQRQDLNLPGQQAPSNQVASADPTFVPPMPSGMPQQANATAGLDLPNAAAPPPGMAFSQPGGPPITNGGPAPPAAPIPPSQPSPPPVLSAPTLPPSAPTPQADATPPTPAGNVTNALVAGGPPVAPAPPPNLSPGGQQVAQALLPQQQGQPDMSKIAAVMANPWVPPEEKAMLMQRFQPHKMITVPTQGGTMLMDELTGQQRGFIPSPNYQKVTGIDGVEHVYNMNDPQQAQLAAGVGQPGAGSMLPGQKTVQQMFPGMKPTTDQENYAGYYNQQIAAGVDPSKIENIKQYEMEKKSPLVEMGQETSYNQTRGKALGEAVNSYMTGGQNAYKELQALNTIDDALAAGQGHIFTGPGSELALNVKQALGNLFGVNPEGTGASEIINKTGAQLASAAAKNLASRPTQFDFATFLKNNPGLDISPQGNAFMINIMKQQAQHEIELGNLATHYKGDGSDWQDTVDQYYKAHPFMSPITGQPLDAKQTLFPAPGGQQGGSPSPASPTQATPQNAPPAIPPPQPAIEFLRGNPTPEFRQYFDQKYGSGAAARALGEKP